MPIHLTIDFPEDLIAYIKEAGPVEWGAVAAKTDEDHITDFGNTLRLTKEQYKLPDTNELHGLFVVGTEIVMAHTGTSPAAPKRARILDGLWNALYHVAIKSGAAPDLMGTTEKTWKIFATLDASAAGTANAELIVKAVDAYPSLIEAIESAIEFLDHGPWDEPSILKLRIALAQALSECEKPKEGPPFHASLATEADSTGHQDMVPR